MKTLDGDWKDCIGLTYNREPITVEWIKEVEPCLSFEEWCMANKKPSLRKRVYAYLKSWLR